MKISTIALVAALAVVMMAGRTSAREFVCKNPHFEKPIFKTIVHGAGECPEWLSMSVDHFKGLLGGEDNGSNPGPFPSGQRSVNWDAPIVPFEMPKNFFDKTVTRGLKLFSKNNQFRVSNPRPNTIKDRKFSTINPAESETFVAFSEKRLFTPFKDNEFWIKFTVPGTSTRAVVKGFGAVFVGVDLENVTEMIAYDADDCIVARSYVEASPKGLSFLGFYFHEPIIARVSIKLGDGKINSCRSCDIVVLDDFIYGEPQRL